MTHIELYCCQCGCDVQARLTNGKEIYPHRPDLYQLPFWRCDSCKCHVGCHHKTDNPTRPLGCIPTGAIVNMRKRIHAVIDPLWKPDVRTRRVIYSKLSAVLGRRYHTADLRTMEECRLILEAARALTAEDLKWIPAHERQ